MGCIVESRYVNVPIKRKGIFKYILPKTKSIEVDSLSIEDAVSALVGDFVTIKDIWFHSNKDKIFDLYDQYLETMGIEKKYSRRPIGPPPQRAHCQIGTPI